MKAKRFILMLLVALMSATGAYASLKDVDYIILSYSDFWSIEEDINELKTPGEWVEFSSPGTLVIDAQESICLTSYILTPNYDEDYLPKSVSVEGSNDQSTWTMLKSGDYNFQVDTPKTIELDGNTPYRYYRFTFIGNGYVELRQLQICVSTFEGDGTVSNPYILDDYQSWQKFYDICATNPAACGKLTADLDFTGNTWNPTGNFQYRGTLDGNNHVLSNLSSSVGIFQNMGAATVKDLTIVNASLTTTDENSGVFASQANGTIFQNCIIKGSISSNGTNAGGFVGNATGCTFTKCYSIGNYSVGGTNAGALVGNADGSTTFNQCFAATNLNNDGDVHLPVCGGGNATFNNTYYYGTGSETAVTKTDLGNGRLAYLLNDGNITGPYFQRIGTDDYPHWTNTGQNYVYLAFDDVSYTNACPHRDCTIYPFTTPSCLGTNGNIEYGKCNNSLCGKYFPTSDRNAVTTNTKEFTISSKAVNIQDHYWYNLGYWDYSASKGEGDNTYYNVMEVSINRNATLGGNYEFSYTVMDDDPTMNLHLFLNANMQAGAFAVRFYVNGTELPALCKNYPCSIAEQHDIVTVDGLQKYDRIKVVLNYGFVGPNSSSETANLFVGTEKTFTISASHDFHKCELTYDCIEGGYREYYECDICKHVFTQGNHPDSDADIKTLSYFAIAPVGAHDYLIEGNLYRPQCKHEFCKTPNPDGYILKNYNNGTDIPLSYDGNSYTAKTTVNLTDAKEYVTPVAFSTESLEYQRTFYTNVWNPWFVPFATTVSELAENGVTDVACIESIHNYDTDYDGVVDKTVLEVILKKNGTVKAGVPYMVKTDNSYTYPMAFTNKVMNVPTDTKALHSETISAAYDFMGTYSGLTAGEVNAANIFSLNSEGAMVHRTGKILPQRWYMKEVSKDNVYEELSPAMSRTISIRIIGEDDETTGIRTIYTEDKQTEELLPDGIFDLNGRKLSAPQSGKINIINGKKQFVK